jgi:glycosyltransferase involved in cell wall biosynthesis
MLSKPLVSIVIPVKDRFEWFTDCLQSVLDQEYQPIEIIVVDDASSSSVADFILRKWPEKKSCVVVIRNLESVGTGAAREAGRLKSCGEYISYLDSDDVIHPLKIQKQVEFLSTHPEFGMCYCRSNVFSELPLTGQEDEYRPANVISNEILPQLLISRPWGTGACLWTKEACDLIGPWSTLRAGEDQEYEFRAGLNNIKAYQMPEVLCFVRRGEEFSQLHQQNEFCRTENAKMYIEIANHLCGFGGKIDKTTRFMVAKNLILSTIFLLSINKKLLATRSLRSLLQLMEKKITSKLVVYIIIILNTLLPRYFMFKLLHLFRFRIFSLLQTKN